MSSNSSITVRYDGPALSGHQMDVSDLASALIGISELYQHANSRFNGDKASVKVLISTDTEHQCVDEPQVVSAWITVYAPVYDLTVKSWRFRYGEVHYYMDISETSIAEDAINRGGAAINLEETLRTTIKLQKCWTSSLRKFPVSQKYSQSRSTPVKKER